MSVPAFTIQAERDQLVVDRLRAAFPDGVVADEQVHDMRCITVRKEVLHPALRLLRDELDFNFLTTLCGMHYPGGEGAEERLGLVVHLNSFRSRHRIRLKAYTAMKDPVFPTFTDLWPTTNWMEREAWDFFGISFTGHPNLKRILNMEDFPAFPLRKDYPLEDPTREDKDNSMFGR